jgi:aminopeptidase-like protein
MTGTLSQSMRWGQNMNAGEDMLLLAKELFPICRSITGDGLRRSLEIIRRHIPLQLHEIPSGTRAYDWTVPPEWNIRRAFIEARDGRRIIDFAHHNLHVVQYSRPLDAVVPLWELQKHLHSLPDRPDWIPYRTSYYE